MIRLSVNVNRIATLRNSRGGIAAERRAGGGRVSGGGRVGITVHPREDQRHIRPDDVVAIAARLAPLRGRVELNIEGDPRPALVDLVVAARADQCTLVPVTRGEITSQAGWTPDTPFDALGPVMRRLQAAGVRVSLFVDPEERAVVWARRLGADRVELYTEPFAAAFVRGGVDAEASFALTPPRRRPRTRSGSVSTPATISTSRTSRVFARCRIWTRCPSATP